MDSNTQLLLTLAVLFLLGLLTDAIGKRTFLPRVTLLLLFGVIFGQSFLNLLPQPLVNHFELIADIALLMIGFLLGGKLTKDFLQHTGIQALVISLSAALITFMVVFLGLFLVSVPVQVAIILGSIAAATAPATTVDLILESGYKGKFSQLLLSIVALDDIWALVIFSLCISVVQVINGNGFDTSIIAAFGDIAGAVLIGVLVGIPSAFLTGRIKSGHPMLTEALGIVFLCGGLALYFEVSFLITSMVTGAVIVNLARHHERPFCEIENIEWPIMIIFFVLAGATLEISALKDIGLIGVFYIIFRIIGKLSGAWAGARLVNSTPAIKNWMGFALLPQAGVAIGIALVASNTFPQYRQIILPVVISSTVLFEVLGPVFARFAILRAERKH